MRTAELDILIVPGWGNSGPEHWQSRWEDKLSTARRVHQPDWDAPDRDSWVESIVAAVNVSTRPVVLVAHSCGVSAVVHAAARLSPKAVIGAFLVAPPSEATSAATPAIASFAPIPRVPLAFDTLVVGSRTDPYCTLEEAQTLAMAWGARFADAGEAGHINTASGHGPWPEGLMRLAGFLKGLSPARAH